MTDEIGLGFVIPSVRGISSTMIEKRLFRSFHSTRLRAGCKSYRRNSNAMVPILRLLKKEEYVKVLVECRIGKFYVNRLC